MAESAANSTHRVEVVRLDAIERHPNADRLGLVRIFGGYPCVVALDQWKEGDLAAYVPPDSVVPVWDAASPFHFLKTKLDQTDSRVRAKRLRGIVSMGLLVPAPEGAQVGDDVAERLGVSHWEPPPSSSTYATGGETEAPPPGYRPSYDLDSLRRYADAFAPEELVWVTEKIHGAQGRFCWSLPKEPGAFGRFFCGSKKEWKQKSDVNLWWRALTSEPGLMDFLRTNPDCTVYGEVYGQVHDLKYGTEPGEVRVAVFDILRVGEWMPFAEVITTAIRWEFETVPVLSGSTLFNLDAILALAEGPTHVRNADHLREGIVVRPHAERRDDRFGRVVLKVVSGAYLAR